MYRLARRSFSRLQTTSIAIVALIVILGVPTLLTYGVYASHHGRAEVFHKPIIDAGYTITHESDGYDGRINFRIKPMAVRFICITHAVMATLTCTSEWTVSGSARVSEPPSLTPPVQ